MNPPIPTPPHIAQDLSMFSLSIFGSSLLWIHEPFYRLIHMYILGGISSLSDRVQGMSASPLQLRESVCSILLVREVQRHAVHAMALIGCCKYKSATHVCEVLKGGTHWAC